MKKLLGLTGPSGFSKQCAQMIEHHIEANFVSLIHENENNLNYWLDKCDGFVISGGVDIHPSLYGCNVISGANLTKFDIQRDIRELKILDHALNKNKPFLSICRGHQLLSIILGLQGEFVVDLSGTTTVHQPSAKNITASEYDVMHAVEIINTNVFPKIESEERKVLATILGEEGNRLWVNSFHHQGIVYLTKNEQHYSEKGIIVVGTAAAELDKKRNIIELMIGKDKKWVSTQWHPEYDYEFNTRSKTVLIMYKKILDGRLWLKKLKV